MELHYYGNEIELIKEFYTRKHSRCYQLWQNTQPAVKELGFSLLFPFLIASIEHSLNIVSQSLSKDSCQALSKCPKYYLASRPVAVKPGQEARFSSKILPGWWPTLEFYIHKAETYDHKLGHAVSWHIANLPFYFYLITRSSEYCLCMIGDQLCN